MKLQKKALFPKLNNLFIQYFIKAAKWTLAKNLSNEYTFWIREKDNGGDSKKQSQLLRPAVSTYI